MSAEADSKTKVTKRVADISGESAPWPLYLQVKNLILRRIKSGHWAPESRIPSENELVTSLGISRMTVNRALRELAAEGLLVRRRGAGTFVAPRESQFALLEVRNIAEEIVARGGVHSSDVHLLAREAAPETVAETMGLQTGAEVFHSIIVHRDRGCPVQLADRYVNPLVAPDFLQQDFRVITPSHYLMNVAAITEVEHVIEAVMPDAEIRMLLEIGDLEPCLLLNRITWSQLVVATCNRFYYPGNRFRVGSRFKPDSIADQLPG
jgi:GntR family transcriptional regulator, histidine utilization repressor